MRTPKTFEVSFTLTDYSSRRLGEFGTRVVIKREYVVQSWTHLNYNISQELMTNDHWHLMNIGIKEVIE